MALMGPALAEASGAGLCAARVPTHPHTGSTPQWGTPRQLSLLLQPTPLSANRAARTLASFVEKGRGVSSPAGPGEGLAGSW